LSEDEALALARQLLTDCARRWHGVFHPYFHPISLAGRGSVACQTWFRQILRAARELGLPSVNAREWLAFNDARRAVTVDTLSWEGQMLVLALQAPLAVAGLTLLLPPWCASQALAATVAGASVAVTELEYEGMRWAAVVLDLPAQSRIEVRVTPRGRSSASSQARKGSCPPCGSRACEHTTSARGSVRSGVASTGRHDGARRSFPSSTPRRGR
jgi:hypothetical protein